MVRIERFDTSCRCGFPLSVRIFDGQRLAYFKRPGQPGDGRSITRCPSCREDFPQLSPAEFKDRVWRLP